MRVVSYACCVQWELKEEQQKKKEKSEDVPSSHFVVSELLHHLLATCDPADIMDALPDLTSVITAWCLPHLPDSPLVEELDNIKEFMART